MWSNAVGCCEFHFYGFFIMNISVCFLEKSTQFLYESCGPGTEILVPMLTFVHDGRGTSINVLFHPYLRDARSSSFTASKHNWFYFTGDLASF
ncbi:hypothetical protein DAPPUDRAFT_311961 [Daphnia pulex]|uniref:Uncharacterized protein n=1 Tax=Daphnia pulex TaxID=6669 RepID=E9FYF8_DAPPU|nr:hypothetical protein DAPPUDRAFT_311961 [Daphnia pulex]|eukprot:EFX87524.1 hypothetical protein DAPPUDRAFT_311961 [Daphnia pulex]